MRIYFVNAGLNLDSNFHPIGSHWDRVWEDAALLNPPLRGIQTILVPAGGGTVVDLIGQVPMTVVLVDHALARAFDKGAIGQIVIDGAENPEIFETFGVTPSRLRPTHRPAPSGSAPVPSSSAPAPSPSIGRRQRSGVDPRGFRHVPGRPTHPTSTRPPRIRWITA